MTDRDRDASGPENIFSGTVKWYDTSRNFGFVVCDDVGEDVAIFATALRDMGLDTIADGAQLTFHARRHNGRLQVAQILEVRAKKISNARSIISLQEDAPAVPARVKWFDAEKGFGFVNVFGERKDVFLHALLLDKAGFASVKAGDAMAVRVEETSRGPAVAEVLQWNSLSGQ